MSPRFRPRVREDKDETAKCPFCSHHLMAPEEIKTDMGEGLGGRCACGAVYILDPTGHNMGEAYLDALSLAFGDDWDRISGEGYEEAVLSYDQRRHRLSPVRDVRRLDTSPKIIFIKAKRRE